MASFEDFLNLDLRIGRIVRAEEFPEARKPAYKLDIDLGPLGTRRSSAQLTHRYRPSELVGRMVVAVCNLPARQVGPVRSEVLVLGACPDDKDVVLLRPDVDVEPGTRVG